MTTSKVIAELLKDKFPIESETVGFANLLDISESEVNFIPAENGSFMDLGSAIGILVIATSFIKNVIDIYISLKKELGRKPEKDEIKTAITKNTCQKLDENTREQLIEAVIKRLDERSMDFNNE